MAFSWEKTEEDISFEPIKKKSPTVAKPSSAGFSWEKKQPTTPTQGDYSPAVEQAVASLPIEKKTFGEKFKAVENYTGDIAEEIPLGVGSAFGNLPSGVLSGIQTLKRRLQTTPQNTAAFKVFKTLFPEQAEKVDTRLRSISANPASQGFDTMIAKAKEKTDVLKRNVNEGVQAYREGRDLTGKVTREEDKMNIAEKGVNALATTVGYMIPAFLAAPAAGANAASMIGGFIEAGSDSSQVYDDLIAQGKSKKEAEDKADTQFATSAVVNGLSGRFGIFGNAKSFLKRIINSELTEVPAETITTLSSNILTGRKWHENLVETAITTAAITPFLGAMGGNLSMEQQTILKEKVEEKLNQNEEFKNLTPFEQEKVIEALTTPPEPTQDEITQESLDEITNEITQFKQTEPYLKPEAKQDEALFKKAPVKPKTAPEQAITPELEPLAKEARKYKSAEEFVKKTKGTKAVYSLEDTGVDTVYHNTSPESARSTIFADTRNEGLNVSSSQDLALGQGGKGVTIEFDTYRLEGRKIQKPGAEFIEATSGKYPEFEISKAPSKLTPDVKSVTFDKPLSEKGEMNFFGLRQNWKDTKQILPDGKVKYTNPNYKTKSQLTDIYNKATKEQPDEKVSYKKGLETIKGFQERLGVQFPVYIYEKIYTGATTAGSPQQAFGMYLDNTISLAQAITRFTADHEVGHFVFRNLENMPAFKGITREQLLTELRTKYGNLSDVALEEKLMEDLEVYAKQLEDSKPTTFKGKVKQFFEGMYQTLTDVFGISKKQMTSIDRFFDRMYFGKNKNVVSFYDTGKTSNFMEKRFKEFGEEPVMFKKIEGEFTPEEISLANLESEYQEIVQDEDFISPVGEMPEDLYMRGIALQEAKIALKESPLRILAKFEAKSGEFKGQLPEKFGGDKTTRDGVVFGRSQDEYASDLNYDGSEQMREAYTAKYQKPREQYKKDLASYQAELKKFRESKTFTKFLEEQALKGDKAVKERNSKLYVKTSLNLIREKLPRKEHAQFMTRLSQVGTSESRYLKLVKSVMERKAELDIENDSRIDRARLRSDIGYLKKVYDIEPSLILSIKEKLDIRDNYKTGEKAGQPKEGLKSIKEFSIEELGLFMDELQTRIQFRKDNPINYLALAKLDEKKTVMQKITSAITKVDETVIATMERTVQKMSNSVYESMMTIFHQIAKSSQIYETKVTPVLDIYKKATPEDKELIKMYSQSSEEAKLRQILGQYATAEEVDTALNSSREVLDEIHKDLTDVGVDVPYRGFFFPRKLKKLTMEQAELALRVFEHKMSTKATQEEKAVILNNFLRGMDVTRLPFVTLSGKRFETHRMIETLTSDLSPFYEDFDVALNSYVGAAIQTIELRKYFGKFQIDSLDYDAALSQSIGAKVYDLVEKGIVKSEDLTKLQDIMQTLFQYRVGPNEQRIQDFTNNLIYPLTLGQIGSTINQLKDLSLQMLLNDIFAGQLNTLGSMKIKPEDVYLTDTLSAVNLEAGTMDVKKISKIILAPFGKADKTFLRIFINSASRRLVKLARTDNKKLQQQLTDVFGEEKGVEVMAELKSQNLKDINLSEEMKRLLFSEVAKTRPITKLQKTRTAVRHPILYTLRNFMIKQIQFMRSQAFDVISDGVKTKDAKKVSEGIARLAIMMAVIGFFGASVDELKDWVLGKSKDKSFWNRLTDNLLQTVGLNSYLLTQGQKSGYAMQFLTSYTPATVSVLAQIVDNAVKDTQDIIDGDPIYEAKTLRKFPLVGELYYQRFGGGAD